MERHCTERDERCRFLPRFLPEARRPRSASDAPFRWTSSSVGWRCAGAWCWPFVDWADSFVPWQTHDNDYVGGNRNSRAGRRNLQFHHKKKHGNGLPRTANVSISCQWQHTANMQAGEEYVQLTLLSLSVLLRSTGISEIWLGAKCSGR